MYMHTCVYSQTKMTIFQKLAVYSVPYHCFAIFTQPYFLDSSNGKIILDHLLICFANISYLEAFLQLGGN